MTIEPQSNIKLLSNVPLDNTYKDTLTFGSLGAQTSYFSGKARYSFSSCRYQRETGQMFVECNAEDVFDCNYVMFQNANFGSKWFYAFIQRIDYLNPKTTAITFELDVLQTWYYEYTVKECFVEREHVANDAIGANTVPENIEHGPYVTTSTRSIVADDWWVIGLYSDFIDGQGLIAGGIMGGTMLPLWYARWSGINANTYNEIIAINQAFAEAGKTDAIVGYAMVPSKFCSIGADVNRQTVDCAPRTLEYTPRNNKLYTFPYVALSIVCPGQSVNLRYELFNDPNQPTMQIVGGFGFNPPVMCRPVDYAGMSAAVEYTITIKDWPVLPWVGNYYENWVAQNKANLAVSTIGNVLKIGGGIVAAIGSGGIGAAAGLSVAASGVSGLVDTAQEVYQHSLTPDRMEGSAAAGDIMSVAGNNGFYSYCRCIQPEYARIIDDYFDMYGYAVNRVKVPDRSSRPSWNYVKTKDAVITGTCPVDDMAKIRAIFDRGLTFWHGDYVGDYSRSNK